MGYALRDIIILEITHTPLPLKWWSRHFTSHRAEEIALDSLRLVFIYANLKNITHREGE